MTRRSKTSTNDAKATIRRKIQECMHQKESLDKRFICRQKLDLAWDKSGYQPKDVPELRHFSDDDITAVREHYLRTISLLIFVGWSDLRRFRPVFMKTGKTDRHLPYSRDNLPDLGEQSETFYSEQFLFDPEPIWKDHAKFIQKIAPERRLPFVDAPEHLGAGGFGAVTKRTIASRCLRTRTGHEDNIETIAVACKTYTTERPVEDFHKEVQILDFIKGKLQHTDRILRHYAAIEHDRTFMIVLPLAKHHSLEHFLLEGMTYSESSEDLIPKYDFNETFPLLDQDSKLAEAILHEAFELASALNWLHRELRLWRKSNYYLAHMDIKPDNILLSGDPTDPETPAGKWMLSDFGVSSFDRQIGHKVTSRAPPKNVIRGQGAYQPPEIILERETRKKMRHDEPKCDVWAFSCLLYELLAFALGKSDEVKKLRKIRDDGIDDNFFEMTPLPNGHHTEITATNTHLKRSVRKWASDLLQSSPPCWVEGYLVFLNKTMQAVPAHRENIDFVCKELERLKVDPLSMPSRPASTQPDLPDDGASAQSRKRSISFTDGHDDRSGTGGSLLQVPNTTSALAPAQKTLSTHPPTSKAVDPAHVPTLVVTNGEVKVPTIPSPHETPSNTGSMTKASASTQSYQESLLSASVRVDAEFREYGRFKLNLLGKKRVKWTAINPDGEFAAALYDDCVVLYDTKDGSRLGEPVNISTSNAWSKLRLAYPYFVLWGGKGHAELRKHLEPERLERFESVFGPKRDPLLDILLSGEGVVACLYARDIEVSFFQASERSRMQIPKSEAIISSGSFSLTGNHLYLWLKGPVKDSACTYQLNFESKSANLCGARDFYANIAPRAISDIWPSPISPFSVIHDNHGGFVADGSSLAQRTVVRKAIDLRKSLLGVIPHDNLLLCLEGEGILRRDIAAYEISPMNDTRKLMTKRFFLGKADRHIKRTTGLAVLTSHTSHDLILCLQDGTVLKYTQRP